MKKYKIEHPLLGWEIHFEVDRSKKEILELYKFWFGSDEDSLEEKIQKVLKMIASEAFRIGADRNYNTEGIKSILQTREGFGKMDGTYGINLTYCDNAFTFIESEDFEIVEE